MNRRLIIQCLLLFSSMTGNVFADDGTTTMNITGTVTAEGCNVDVDSATQNIKIGDFSAAAFPTVGTTSASVQLPIKLTNCSSGITGAKVTFSGNADSTNNQLLALNSGADMATGVGVEILDSAGAAIPVNGTSTTQTLSAGDNTMNFALRYKSTQSPVLPGDASAILYFDIGYQ